MRHRGQRRSDRRRVLKGSAPVPTSPTVNRSRRPGRSCASRSAGKPWQPSREIAAARNASVANVHESERCAADYVRLDGAPRGGDPATVPGDSGQGRPMRSRSAGWCARRYQRAAHSPLEGLNGGLLGPLRGVVRSFYQPATIPLAGGVPTTPSDVVGIRSPKAVASSRGCGRRVVPNRRW